MSKTVRVACFGSGNFATKTHLPNLRKLPGVEIVALCDVDKERLAAAGREFGVTSLYADCHEMLQKERIDALFSVVRAYQRTDCEVVAAKKGIHLFIEKPQAADMEKAKEIDRAIRQSGVISTVGFRERFRPTVEAARKFMADKQFLHAHMFFFGELRPSEYTLDQMGGDFLDWGGHFIDQVRHISGHDVGLAQAFFVEDPDRTRETDLPLVQCAAFRFDNGSTASWDVLSCLPVGGGRLPASPGFFFAYKGGILEVGYEELKENGEVALTTPPADPWFLSVKAFIEAVRTGDRSLIRNDFSDGLLSLAPVLAARESARKGGELIRVREFAGV